MSNEERLRKLLSDLGKATLRGIRKCPKCGTYNGSRGLCCKNKYCDKYLKNLVKKENCQLKHVNLLRAQLLKFFL